ncbi:MAG: hypothetical protein R2707_00010 [Acidimicrobiales bacterium]
MILAPPELPPDPPDVLDVQHPSDVLGADGETVADGNLTLHWTAPPACPDGAKVLTTVSRYLSEESRPDEPLAVHGRVDHAADLWTLELVLQRGEHQSRRNLEAGTCDLLTKGAALVVAVHIDAVGASAQIRELETPVVDDVPTPPAAAVEVSRSPPPEATVTVRRPPVRPPPPPPAVGGVVRAVLTGGVGDVPRFPHGFAVAGGVTLSAFRIEGQLDYAPPRRIDHPDNADLGGRFQAVAGTLRGCWAPVQGRFSFPLCLGARVNALQGEGRQGIRRPQTVWSPWGAIALEPAVVFSPIDRLGIFASVGALAAFNRPAFRLGPEQNPIFRVSAISAVVSFGLEVNFSPRNSRPR